MIVPVSKHGKAFQKCHRYVIEQLAEKHDTTLQDIEAEWANQFSIGIIRGQGWGEWQYLVFPGEQAYTLWVMKWS